MSPIDYAIAEAFERLPRKTRKAMIEKWRREWPTSPPKKSPASSYASRSCARRSFKSFSVRESP